MVFEHLGEVEKEIHGFAGYFEAQLYQDVRCSIEPRTHTLKMRSWFPIYFPILRPELLSPGAKLEVQLWRRSDEEKVWYEWQFRTEAWQSEIHNLEGRSYAIRKL